MFHDDGRFLTAERKVHRWSSTLYKTLSTDGGLTWSFPEADRSAAEVHLCEPGVIRSPDGKQLAVLLRENRRVKELPRHLLRRRRARPGPSRANYRC